MAKASSDALAVQSPGEPISVSFMVAVEDEAVFHRLMKHHAALHSIDPNPKLLLALYGSQTSFMTSVGVNMMSADVSRDESSGLYDIRFEVNVFDACALLKMAQDSHALRGQEMDPLSPMTLGEQVFEIVDFFRGRPSIATGLKIWPHEDADQDVDSIPSQAPAGG